MNIPNLLSVFRILLVPLFAYQMVVMDNFFAAGIILLVSGLTDCCDGYIARKFNMITNLGKILDPVADKLTQVVVIFCLAFSGYRIMWTLLAFYVVKDLALLIGGIALYKKKDLVVSSNLYGKLATIIFYFLVIIVTLFYPYLTETVKLIIALIIILAGAGAFVGYILYYFSIKSKKIQ